MWPSRHVHRSFWFTTAWKTKYKLIFGAHHEPKSWNDHILATNYPFETSQRADLIAVSYRNIVLLCGAFNPYATIRPMIEKRWSMGSSLAHQTSKFNCLISANADGPCTTRVERQVGQVWACSDGSGRFYRSTAVARQVKTSIFSKLSTLKTACLALISGPQLPQGTGKHVVKPDLALPAPYKLGTA